jgi:uncharacterized glyoxalase superfamily protein PhnB
MKMATKKKTSRAKARTRTAKRSTTRPKKTAPRRAQQRGFALSGVAPSFTVNDVDASLAWYRDVIGFAVGERWEEGGKLLGVELKAGDAVFMIGQDDWKKGRNREKGVGFRLYCSTTQDVDTMAAGIKSRGGMLVQEPKDEEWGGRAFTVDDPDGFRITISNSKAR